MERSLRVISALCLIACCHSLGLVLKRETSAVSRDRRLCGVLICEEIVSPTSDKARTVPSVVFDNIESMSVFKRVSTTSDVSASDKREDLIGSVTSEAPSLSQVANGRKIDGLLEAGRATIRVELVKQDDCQAEFVCQVRGLDTQGRQALSSSSLVPHPSQREDQVYDRREMPAMSLQLYTSLQQLISQSVEGLVNRLDTFERRLDVFENRIEDKIDNNNNLNKLIQLDSKVSTELAQFRTEARTDILDSLDTMKKRVYDEQKDALKNVSELFKTTLNNTSDLLSSMESELDLLKTYGQMNLVTVRNETEAIREMLTSREVSSRCLKNAKTTTDKKTVPVVCIRGMNGAANKTYPKYIKTSQFTLHREILCDTQTDGGGWTVIQRRTKGDVFFNRDWDSYKEGFGKLDGDFWLGNEAIHILTYVQPQELMVELRSEGKDYFATYKSFLVKSESDKYRLQLGAVSSSLDDGNYGLSYSNGASFSTFDRDNDQSSGSCAITYKAGWWYKQCEYSRLNSPWSGDKLRDAWYNGKKRLHVTSVEMKIRPVKTS
ncbi:hypothetical protein RRG08_066638 [Elysia crispata]|uniref:Fibrinogen C-terminal domain-containing protein n=1 Tax=Elysia crispata TaxID=231223 RepID=A0AAE0ZL91_9GAST|nr:hypothetical protein RRG08_066638 [Elysia crispata]